MLDASTDFAIPFAADDQVIECTANDPVEYDSPADWPEWTDADRWAHGPAITPDESFPELDQAEPTAADVAWLNANPALPPIAGGSPEPTDADWDELARWSVHLERLDDLRRESDAEHEACMRFGGSRRP